jgi:type IV pilus assembly protein PilM
MQPHADELIREIRRSLNYYQSQQTEHGAPNPVTQVLISGGGARMTGLTEYAAHKLGLSAACRGVFDNPRFMYGGTNDPGNGLEYSVASGLALRAFARAA